MKGTARSLLYMNLIPLAAFVNLDLTRVSWNNLKKSDFKEAQASPLRPHSGGGTRTLCLPSKEHPPMNSSPNAPWKDGSEHSER
jgi:hypothetical protein